MDEWIDTNSQLPMQGEKVLCWQKGIGYAIAYWGEIMGGGIYWAEEEHGPTINSRDFPVTHWMSLPEPPQEADG